MIQIRGDLGSVDLGQVPLDLPDRQPAGVQADHLLIKPDPSRLALLDDLRLEAPVAIPGRADRDRPLIGQDRLGGLAVASVPRPTRRRLPRWIPEMLTELSLERPVQQPAGELPKEPVRACDLLRSPRATEQRVEHLVAELQRLAIKIRPARQPGEHLSPLGGLEVASLLADRFFLIDPALSSRGHGSSFRPRLHGSSDTPRAAPASSACVQETGQPSRIT